jgi:hypothetical protein
VERPGSYDRTEERRFDQIIDSSPAPEVVLEPVERDLPHGFAVVVTKNNEVLS